MSGHAADIAAVTEFDPNRTLATYFCGGAKRSVTPLAARAQQAAKLPTIGFLGAVGVDAAL